MLIFLEQGKILRLFYLPPNSYTATTTFIPATQVPGFANLTQVTIGKFSYKYCLKKIFWFFFCFFSDFIFLFIVYFYFQILFVILVPDLHVFLL